MSTTSAPVCRQTGYTVGAKGSRTRERLLDALARALTCTAWHELRVIDVARDAGVSPATFYQYFPDVVTAFGALAARVAERGEEQGRHMQLIATLLEHEHAVSA